MSETPQPVFDEWAVFEQVGRNQYAAHVTVETIADHKVYRLDVPRGDGYVTKYIAPGTMYAIHPTSEEVVRHLAKKWGEPTPAARWELPAGPGEMREAVDSAVEWAMDDGEGEDEDDI